MSEQDGERRVQVTENKLAVLLDCVVDVEKLDDLAERIKRDLVALGLTNAPLAADLKEMLEQAATENPEIVNLSLMEGEAPVMPKDGRIEWADDFFSTGFSVDEETGRADYRKKLEKRSVSEGQLLARIIPPEPGTAGVDVYGKRIDVPKAIPARIRAGKGASMGEGEDTFFAASNGRVRWISGVLSVDEVYEITGSVNLETGDVSHPGAVVIERDIEAGTKVQADGDIEVKGIVEAAEIDCGGSLLVHGGITGTEDKLIKVAGSVHAKFILEAEVEADGDIEAELEIRQSHVRTQGAVNVPEGRIVGGEATALGGINVGQAGSEASVPTLLIAGQDHKLETAVKEHEKRIKALEKEAKRILDRIAPLVARERSLSAKQREAVTELQMRAYEMKEQAEEVEQEIGTLRTDSEELAKPQILIGTVANPETKLQIRSTRASVSREISGPIRVTVRKDGTIAMNPVYGGAKK